MKFKVKQLKPIISIIAKLKNGEHFSLNNSEFTIMANTQLDFKRIRLFFKGTIWKKRYHQSVNWWDYHSKYKGIPIRIWGISDAPKACKAIMETKIVTEQVPTGYKTVTHEKEVLVGWDCGNKTKKKG